ncbi:MAG TPA: hypothetical protein VGD42_13815 [Lysobacter sp.]
MSAGRGEAYRLPPLRWHQWLLILMTLVVIVLLRKVQPTQEQKLAPIATPGSEQLERVAGRNFAVDVHGFKVARAYQVGGDLLNPRPRLLATTGVWLSVVTEIEALQTPGYISAQLRTRDGLVYRADTTRLKLRDLNLGDRAVAPGLPERGAYFFELPPTALEGLRLQVYWGNLTPTRMDSLVDIDLGIDAARARRLLAEAKPVVDLRR